MVLNICCSIRPQLLSSGKLDCKELDYDCNDPELHRCDDKIEQIPARGDSYNSCLSAAGLDHSSASFGYVLVSNFLSSITSLEPDEYRTNVGRNCSWRFLESHGD